MKEKRFSAGKFIVYLILIFWALTTIYPLAWVFLNSFKDKKQIMSNSFALPMRDLFTTDNYGNAFQKLNIFGAYRNSLIISCSAAALVILFAGMASYALVRYSFRGRKLLNNLVIAAMMFPVFATIIPVYRMEFSWGIVNTQNLWLSLLSCALPQIAAIWLLRLWSSQDIFRDFPLTWRRRPIWKAARPSRSFQCHHAAD